MTGKSLRIGLLQALYGIGLMSLYFLLYIYIIWKNQGEFRPVGTYDASTYLLVSRAYMWFQLRPGPLWTARGHLMRAPATATEMCCKLIIWEDTWEIWIDHLIEQDFQSYQFDQLSHARFVCSLYIKTSSVHIRSIDALIYQPISHIINAGLRKSSQVNLAKSRPVKTQRIVLPFCLDIFWLLHVGRLLQNVGVWGGELESIRWLIYLGQ